MAKSIRDMVVAKTKMAENLPATTPAELNEKLKKALNTIDRKLKALGVVETVIFQAPSGFKYNELDGNTINIQTSFDLDYLIKALSLMKQIRHNYDDTCVDLGLKTVPIAKWLGVPVDAWINDLTIRIKLVANTAQITELQKAKTDLTTFLSTEDRLVSTLNRVKDLL